ncbi:helicase-associated domain-containing protein [Actinacidiphila soli]|uniref:helicase-associated domain-containing protein n=1 Tax=Actinacidiphila soli TaxID=2487275 RepID=UPI000FC9F037|nr:helicase-associated domain-containing protein [Actinacidiphila soli]
MSSATALKSWLASRTREQLAELLEQRDLPQAAGYGSRGLTTLGQLAEHLLTGPCVSRALREVTLGDLQVLVAVARLAERLHGPLEGGVPTAPGQFGYPAVRAGQDPAKRAVPRRQLLDWLADGAEQRADAEAALERLAERALILPPHTAKVSVPLLFHQRVAELQGLGGPADALLSAAYNAPEIHRIAEGLGLPKARTRNAAQLQIATLLGDPQRVRELVATAPGEARDLLDKLVAGPALLRTHCFTTQYGYYSGPNSKFLFRAGGSGDPGTDWLAARGLVVPVGTDLAELPYEIGHALRDDHARPAFQPAPPPVTAVVPLPRTAAGEAQSAAATAVSRAELLLRATAAQPLAVRKAGGIAVRDTKRLAKAAGAAEQQARLWLDLAANADLIAPHHDEMPAPRGRSRKPAPPSPARMLPTDRYDDWLAASPTDRLLPLLATWAVTPEVFSYWPDQDETPVALISPQDPMAVPLRTALLDALAHLPPGQGLAPGRGGSPGPEAVAQLLACAAWFQPALADPGQDTVARTEATLHEAEILGVTAHGALTAAGHAVLALLHAGAARHFPTVPGAGPDLSDHPALAAAIRALGEALSQLLPPPQTTARFQADLTATVTGAASPELTDLLSTTADRESEGHAVVWRISPGSLCRAFNSGLDATELLEHLAAVSEGGAPLPQPLEYTVKDTARTHGRMRVVRSACCIRSDDESLITELSKVRALTKLGLRRIAPTVLISTAAPDTTLAALRTAGYAPVLEAETGTTIIERAPDQRAPGTMPSLAQARHHRGPGPQTAPALAAELLTAR